MNIKLFLLFIVLTSCASQKHLHVVQNEEQQFVDNYTIENKIERKYFKKHSQNEKLVEKWVGFFSKKRSDLFEKYMEKGLRYQDVIYSILDKYELPRELFFVGLIESGYSTKITSNKSAVGPWQFLRGTAQDYGLQVNQYIDERRSVYKSTEAAAVYLRDLFNIFNSWDLALASYNAGEYRIIRTIRNANTRDYYQLIEKGLIPKETENYIPKMIAAKYVWDNHQKYGINAIKNEVLPIAEPVKLAGPYRIEDVSKGLNIDSMTLKLLNPDIKENIISPSKNKQYRLYLPKSFVESNNINNLNNILTQIKRVKVRNNNFNKNPSENHYIVKKGDSLYKIASSNNMQIEELVRINNLKSKSIRIGQKISLIKTNHNRSIASSKTKLYKVKKGDNLTSIARKFNTTAGEVKSLNNLKKSTVFLGQKIKIPTNNLTIYKVKKGDNLHIIARKFKSEIHDIKIANSMKNETVFPNQKLYIPNFN